MSNINQRFAQACWDTDVDTVTDMLAQGFNPTQVTSTPFTDAMGGVRPVLENESDYYVRLVVRSVLKRNAKPVQAHRIIKALLEWRNDQGHYVDLRHENVPISNESTTNVLDNREALAEITSNNYPNQTDYFTAKEEVARYGYDKEDFFLQLSGFITPFSLEICFEALYSNTSDLINMFGWWRSPDGHSINPAQSNYAAIRFAAGMGNTDSVRAFILSTPYALRLQLATELRDFVKRMEELKKTQFIEISQGELDDLVACANILDPTPFQRSEEETDDDDMLSLSAHFDCDSVSPSPRQGSTPQRYAKNVRAGGLAPANYNAVLSMMQKLS